MGHGARGMGRGARGMDFVIPAKAGICREQGARGRERGLCHSDRYTPWRIDEESASGVQ